MNDRDRFTAIIEEIDQLINQRVTSEYPAFRAWKIKAERFLIKRYGEDSYELKQFKRYSFTLNGYMLGTPQSEFVEACRKDLERVKAIFQLFLEDMNDSECTTQISKPSNNHGSPSVFIVHGHDGELKQSIARILEKQKIQAIILNEQANSGKTIIEKIEKYGDVCAAICLFTPDDLGREEKEPEPHKRARQNVVFETGYFIGRIGRERVIIIADKNIELPSDLDGVVYSSQQDWQIELLKELKALGLAVDFNMLF